ncbi:FtsH protease activity modulator HflK [bacterium]|nr:MAG: FtsH protease activity modulator HflK [bacterium]
MAKQNFSEIKMPPEFERYKKIIKYAAVVLLGVIVVSTTFVTVSTEENAVVLRFGEYQRTLDPGLSFVMPFGIERVYKIPVERQLKLEFGYRTEQAGTRSRYSSRDFKEESLMLTGDLNLAQVEWVVQYRINDPYRFLFKVRNPEKTLEDMSESAMRQIVGDRTVDEVLTIGRQEVAMQVEQLLQEMCIEYENGIKIEQIVLQDVNPPDPVKPSFNGVNEAQQQRERLINEAKAEFNKVIPSAKGEAQEKIQQAEGYAFQRINESKGEVARFNALYQEYVKAPEITKRRMYLETMTKILPKMGNKVILDEKGRNVLPLLQMQNGKGGTK